MVAVISTASVEDMVDTPPRKRLRVDPTAEQRSSREPRLFAPFRALGLVANHVPFVLQARSYRGATEGPRLHLLTCLGKSWAMWEGGKMGLLFVGEFVGRLLSAGDSAEAKYILCLGPDAPEQISSMAMVGNAVWVASGPNVIKYLRGKEVSSVP